MLAAMTLQVRQPILEPGSTCWRTAVADRFVLLPDGESFMPAMRAAMEGARQSIMLLGWDFDPRIPLNPSEATGAEPDRLCDLFSRVLARRPSLRIQILIWDMSRLFAWQRRDRPQNAARWLPAAVQYRLDAQVPIGAAHHQKLLVVDDGIAFCGGADFTRNRWDTREHLSNDPRRRRQDGGIYPPRHEVMAAVDGSAASCLADLARDRWLRAGGVPLSPVVADDDPWPTSLVPDVVAARVGISRTTAAHGGHPEVREVEALYLRAISQARRWIYIENQYFTAPSIGAALARRLAEDDGPDILVIAPLHSGGRADRFAMDRARNALVQQLRAADRHGRFRALAPLTSAGEPVIVHSKVMVVDEQLFRVGSANLNRRSLGLDTECDLCIEAEAGNDRASGALLRLLARLLSEHLGCEAAQVEDGIRRTGRLLATFDAIAPNSRRRLQAVGLQPLTVVDRVIARRHLYDPAGVADNWRPWRRGP